MARSVNDRLQDETIAHGLYVTRYGTGVARRMVALLNKLDAELAAKLLVLLDGKRADTYSARRLASLLAGVRELNQQAYEPVNAALARELTRYVEYEAGYQLDLFSSIIPQQILKHVPLQSIAPEQVYAAAAAQPFQGRLLKEWGQKLEADRLDKITNAVRSGFLQGETVEQIVRRVAGTPKLNREDGVINASRRDLAVVTRTAVNHMAATARQEFALANSDIVKAKQWSSTLDTHTSQWCIIRDRKLYTPRRQAAGACGAVSTRPRENSLLLPLWGNSGHEIVGRAEDTFCRVEQRHARLDGRAGTSEYQLCRLARPAAIRATGAGAGCNPGADAA